MLFTTIVFVFAYLPVTLAGFFAIARYSHAGAAAFLFAASLFFYGYWMPQFTLLLLASITINYFIGREISRRLPSAESGQTQSRRPARLWFVTGLVLNLSALAYFKYANFFVDTFNAAFGANVIIAKVILPIGISFFTFTQIAFLADVYLKGVREFRFVHYGLFVTYFPHLIAGPVLHHAQMMPQFRSGFTYVPNSGNLVGGLCIFLMGLFKKVVLADGISPYADAVFVPADAGVAPTTSEAWLGVMAYTMQLYFDFSGYSDMAIGLSWMFNVKLPFNFDSPYRATSISEFWRKWHISLSDFLRDYLYIAMGGNRLGPLRRHINLMTTMLLGGLWHGANWTFVFWGGLHGAFLVINHAFRATCSPALRKRMDASRAYGLASWALTILSVMVAWIFFRSETFAGAWLIVSSMGRMSFDGSINPLLHNAGLQLSAGLVWCGALGAIAFLAPNSNMIGQHVLAACASSVQRRQLLLPIALSALVFLLLLNLVRDSVSAFIYFNF